MTLLFIIVCAAISAVMVFMILLGLGQMIACQRKLRSLTAVAAFLFVLLALLMLLVLLMQIPM